MTVDSTPVAALRAKFESLARDSHRFRRSRKGTYVNPQVARDWKWFQLGAAHQSGALQAAEGLASDLEAANFIGAGAPPATVYSGLLPKETK